MIRDDGDALVFDVQVTPRASRERLGPLAGEVVRVQLTAPPVEGAANEALIALVARALGQPRRHVTLVHGQRGRRKTVRVVGATRGQLLALVASQT